MERFKTGDAVFIIPKFAHLYVDVAGVVVDVKADQFRQMFNEYTVEFTDRSTATLFEFQILEAAPNLTTIAADCIFDSEHDEPQGNTRGDWVGRRVLLETPTFHIDLKIQEGDTRGPSIMGQVLERSTNSQLSGLEVRLMREAVPVDAAISDSFGVFEFKNVPEGSLNILVVIPRHSARIFGSFSA
jgi:hypothetical protein